MEKLHQYIQEADESIEEGKLVFFVGAGLSALSEYPQWRNWLMNTMWVVRKKERKRLHIRRIPTNPQIFYDVKGEDAYDEILEKVFAVDKPTNPIHDKILALTLYISLQRTMTT
jgi:NAD-dependent SIR2 family protein deacetylase